MYVLHIRPKPNLPYSIVYKQAGGLEHGAHGATPTVVRGSVQPGWVRAASRTGHGGISGSV